MSQEYAKKERSLESVYDCIGELFDGHADLQAEFVNFLPKKMQSVAAKVPLFITAPPPNAAVLPAKVQFVAVSFPPGFTMMAPAEATSSPFVRPWLR